MKKFYALALLSCTMLGGVSATNAADLIIDEPAPIVATPIAAASGWYIRGDIGYNFKNKTDGDWDFWNQYAEENRGIDDTLRYDDLKLKGGASYGIGVGYRFNEMLRVDTTLDYFRANINGNTRCPSLVKMGMNPPLNLVQDNCNYYDTSTADVWTAMANAYVDLPKIGAITPYLGAGLGAAYVKYGTWTSRQVCANDFPADCAQQWNKGGYDSWRFAMGLMAGASYDLTDQLKLDVGYRYLRINGGNAYGYDAEDKAENTFDGYGPGASGAQGRDNGFNIHTVRAGLRYEFR